MIAMHAKNAVAGQIECKQQSAAMAILRVENLSKAFGTTLVLKDVSLSVDKGEILIIVAPSGSGKTTLLRCIQCLEFPDRGAIVLDGVPFGTGDGPDLRWRPDPPSTGACQAQ